MALLRRLRRDERGIALVLALAMMISFGITITAVIEYTSSNSRASDLNTAQQNARLLAEAGLNAANSRLNYWNTATMQNNAADPTLLGCNAAGTSCTPFTMTLANGTVSWYGSYNTTTSTWTINSTGTARNPIGGAPVTKKLVATSVISWNNTQPSNATAWNYAMATKTSTSTNCDMIVSNSVVIDSPLYLAGNLCLQNTASVMQTTDPVSLNVRGKIGFANTARVGASGSPIANGTVVGGCGTFSGTSVGTTHTCSSSTDPYWVAADPGQPAVTAPTVTNSNMQSYYSSANPGPTRPCDSGTRSGGYPTFDNNSTMDGGAASFNLTPASSYTCKGYDSGGNLVGELSWSASSHVLTIRGTIFFDGNVTATDSSATYNGSATIYLNGTFSMANTSQLCSNTGCDFATWNPNTEMLLIVSGGSAATNISLINSVKFQGGFFTNNTASMQNSVQVMGPMIAGTFDWGNSVVVKPLPTIDTLPLGAPGNPNVHAVPGRFSYAAG